MEKFITRSVELTDNQGFVKHAHMSSVAGYWEHAYECHEYSSVAHKRVVLHLREHGTDQDFSINLSPLGAMALVRRLVDIIDDGVQREGVQVPNLHSDLSYKAARYMIDGESLSDNDMDALIACASSAFREEV